MGDSRYRFPLQSSYSFSASIPSPIPRPLKRRLTGPIPDSFVLSSQPPPAPHVPSRVFDNVNSVDPERKPPSAASGPSATSVIRHNSLTVAHLPSLDPSTEDPGVIFIHPPFTDFPDAQKFKDGLTYNLMAANPNWFLDPTDYISTVKSDLDAIRYPPQLEPPRGWCPTKKKDLKDGWPEGEEPRLRCTFCRRTYAGVNAKSMWRRHVYEKHKIAMSNRRDNQERKGRSHNKENKEGGANDKSARPPTSVTEEYRHQATFLHTPNLPTAIHDPGQSSDRMDEDQPPPSTAINPIPTSADSEPDVFLVASSSTPPMTPGLSPSNPLASRLKKNTSVAESPYDPLLTPSFRHSPARLPSDQPWRFPSPSHPLHTDVRELSLSMLMRAEASPLVSGLDVSPLVIVPASERRKRSIFSSPFAKAEQQDKETCSDGEGGEKGFRVPKSARRFASDAFLPTPFADRVKFRQYRIPESPLGRSFVGREKSLASVAKANDIWRSGGPLSPAKTPGRATGLLDPIELEDSDTFVGMLYKSMAGDGDKSSTKRVLSPPTSSSSAETDSPVVRSSQRSQQLRSSTLAQSSGDGFGLGIGLLEGFSLKEISMADSEDTLFLDKARKRFDLFKPSNGSPSAVIGKKSYREFLNANPQDHHETQETPQPKKRRRTISGRN